MLRTFLRALSAPRLPFVLNQLDYSASTCPSGLQARLPSGLCAVATTHKGIKIMVK